MEYKIVKVDYVVDRKLVKKVVDFLNENENVKLTVDGVFKDDKLFDYLFNADTLPYIVTPYSDGIREWWSGDGWEDLYEYTPEVEK